MGSGMKGVEEFWDRMATAYGDGDAVGRFLKDIDTVSAYISDTLRVDRKSKVLDLCCGNGLITNILARNGISVAGIDISGEMLKKGKSVADVCGIADLKYIQGNAMRLPFADNTFDAAFCLSSFQLFPSYSHSEHVLNELNRVTKPTGRVLIGEVPWKGTLGYMIWKLIRVRGEGEAESYVPFQGLPLYIKMWERLRLVFRRFTGRRVASDEWLWYNETLFQGLKSRKFKKVQFRPSPKKGIVRYQFDVVISNG